MTGQNIKDPKLIERYLEGELLDEAALTPEERARIAKLEEAYLEDSDLLEELMMRKAFKDLEASGDLDTHTHPQVPEPKVADFASHKARRRGWLAVLHSPQYAAAASIAFMATLVLSGLLYLDNRNLRDGGSLDIGATSVVALIATRGADSGNRLGAPGTSGLTVLLVDAGFEPYDSYRAVLERVTGAAREPVYMRDGLELGAYDSVGLAVPNRLLLPGDYEISLAGRMRDWPSDRAFEPVTRMQFTVVGP